MTSDGDDLSGDGLGDPAPVLTPEQVRWNTLSPREQEIARALALGSKNAEISKQLLISTKTVDTHRGHALKKLGCRNNVELARIAIKIGTVEHP